MKLRDNLLMILDEAIQDVYKELEVPDSDHAATDLHAIIDALESAASAVRQHT